MNPVLVYDSYSTPPHFTYRDETREALVQRHLLATGVRPENLTATDRANLFRQDLALTRDDIHSDLIHDCQFLACLRFQDTVPIAQTEILSVETPPHWGSATKEKRGNLSFLFSRVTLSDRRPDLRHTIRIELLLGLLTSIDFEQFIRLNMATIFWP